MVLRFNCVDGSGGSRAVSPPGALRVSSSFAYHVTSLWSLSSCFAAMLFLRLYDRQRALLRVNCVDGSDGSRAVT